MSIGEAVDDAIPPPPHLCTATNPSSYTVKKLLTFSPFFPSSNENKQQQSKNELRTVNKNMNSRQRICPRRETESLLLETKD